MLDALHRQLVVEGQVKADEVEAAVDEAQARGISSCEALAALKPADERRLYLRVAAHCGIDLCEADAVFAAIDLHVARSVPARYCERKRLLPLARHERVLEVASCDPEARTLDLADALDSDRVQLRLVTPSDFRRLRSAVDLGQVAGAGLRVQVRDVDLLDVPLDLESRCSALLDALLVDAVGERASDIHVERYADRTRVRLRVDGDLRDVDHYALSTADALGMINVLKVRARLDISERRLPQDGRVQTRIGGRAYDLRVQTLPCLHGEGAAIRLLPQDRELFAFSRLGFGETLIDAYRSALRSPSGLVLVVGPTGCGKSTTLYAGLQRLAERTSRKVLTVEDPIEYTIDRITQTEARPEIGYAFADSVRAFVRHDPDVIFVGEIRDPETAREALRASQTGHLVLSTLHANDAVDAVQRLYDLGMHPNSIAAELLAVFSQRLVKRICTACRELEPADPQLVAAMFPDGPPADFQTWRGAGCTECRGHGSFGRLAVGESLPSTRELRIAISHQLPLDEIRSVAVDAGLRPIREAALELAGAGVIRFNTLPDVIPAEQLGAASLDRAG